MANPDCAEQIAIEHKRGDFFRDALVALSECPPAHLDYPCKGREGEPCPFMTDGYPDYTACWDEVERRQTMTAHSAGRALTKKERTAIYSIQALLLDFGKQNVGTSHGLTPFQRSQYALADLDYIKRRLSTLCAVQEQEADDE